MSSRRAGRSNVWEYIDSIIARPVGWILTLPGSLRFSTKGGMGVRERRVDENFILGYLYARGKGTNTSKLVHRKAPTYISAYPHTVPLSARRHIVSRMIVYRW